MCGIFGQIGGSPANGDACLAMRHRGPDDFGWVSFQVDGTNQWLSLAQQRLAILDLSPAGHQPMSNEDGTVWTVFNGEIYNFQELRSQLIAAGHRFKSLTDTETLIHGYEEWGEDVVRRLRGMFAFAIWDKRRRYLFLSRDRIGKKPLFYHVRGREFVFASEIKAVLATGTVPAEVDAVAIHDYLTYFYFPPPRTAFRGIFKLPPATCMSLEVLPGGALKRREWVYWDPIEDCTPLCLSRHELVERTRELLEESVRLRLISDVPLGVCLSGGIDSSTITALAARNTRGALKTFSVSFPEQRFYDETPYANMVAEHWQTDHHVLRPNAGCVEVMPKVVRHFDEPFGNPTAVLEYALAELMRQHVTVALSGDGGDELFAGYVRYKGAWAAQCYRRLPGFLTRHLIPSLSSYIRDNTEGRHGFRRVREFAEFGGKPLEDMYLNWVGYFSGAEKRALYTSEFTSLVGDHDSGDFLRGLFHRGAGLDPLNRLGYVDMASFLCCNCLEYTDRMSMAHSLETRCPFTDHKLVEFALKLPFSLKLRGLESKWIVKEAIRPFLPPPVLRKKKVGFNPPIPVWLKGDLRGVVESLLAPSAIERRGIFNAPEVSRLVREHLESRRDNSLKIWALLMFEVWLRLYLDKNSESHVAADLAECRAGSSPSYPVPPVRPPAVPPIGSLPFRTGTPPHEVPGAPNTAEELAAAPGRKKGGSQETRLIEGQRSRSHLQ